jgi:class 3 adenylate cyclase/tetratricopeptide (TPR) repeat protein
VLEEQFTTFQHSLPSAVQAQIFTAPEGENRVLTILFADLTGSTARTAGLAPEDGAALVDQVLKAMVDAILRYEGRINRLLGDAVLAFFGTPVAHENDPERAILAALELREAVQTLGLDVTAGINTGEVYLGAIGAEQHREITAQGPVVVLAARLRERAQPGQILVGETVYRHTRRAFEFAAHRVEAKGFAEPVAAYEVLRPLPRPEKVRGIEGLHAALIGRDRELDQLKEALAEVQAGRGQVACVIGEAGVGKSRLIAELKEVALTPQKDQPLPLWLEGRCLDVGMTVSYWPFLDLLRPYIGLLPEEDEHSRGRRIIAAVEALVTQGALTPTRAQEMLPLLGNLLSARFGSALDERLTHATPEQIKHQTFLALVDLIVAFAHQQPAVVVLEDLHWADSLSLDVMSLLMDALRLAPLFLVCVYRPEREHKCWHLAAIATRKCHERFTEVHLKELTAQQSRRLVESLLHIEALPPAVKEQILAKTQGNPFFVEEVVRSLIDGGLVYHDGEVWRAREEITALAVPESVQSVILSRVDRLEAGVKHVLQSAAVIGRLFQRRLLGQVTQKQAELDQVLQELEDRQLIYEERAIPEEEYSFEHVLTQETVYHNILRRRRVVFHQKVAEGIELLYASSLAGYFEQLAHHYEQAGVDEKTVEYLLKAGEKARRTNLHEVGLACYQKALAYLNAAPMGGFWDDWRLEAQRGLARTSYFLGDVAAAESHIRRAIEVGTALRRPARELVGLYAWLGDSLFWQGRPEEHLRVCEEGLALLGDDVESTEAALMNASLAILLADKGNAAKAREYNYRNATFLRHLPYSEELRDVYSFVVAQLAMDKRVDEAREWLGVMRDLAEQYQDVAMLASYEIRAAMLHASLGDLAGALAHSERSTMLFEQCDANDLSLSIYVTAALSLQLGDLHTAGQQAQRGRHSVQQGSTKGWLQAAFTWQLGVIALAEDTHDRALEYLHNAVQIAGDVDPKWRVAIRASLARAYLRRGDAAEAVQHFEEALSLGPPGDDSHDIAVGLTTHVLPAILIGIEDACGGAERVAAAVEHLRIAVSGDGIGRLRPCLEPTAITPFPRRHGHDGFAMPRSPAWGWHDPLGDCAHKLGSDLLVQAANGRDLWSLNLSAPRLLQALPTGDFAVETVCAPLSDAQPAIGGLLLWRDEQNYLILERGHWGAADIAFRGCLASQHLYLGRGRLPGERMWLRLERQGEQVRALCSADGRQWFTAGDVEFPAREGEQVGVHAIGMIDRTIYHGAFPEGTAIRFESFTVWVAMVP